MPEYARICPNKQDSEYSSRPKYTKILNMAKFWIWQGSQYANVTERSEYYKIRLDRVLNICQNSEYARVTQGSKYARIWLNVWIKREYVMRCAIWYHLYNLKNVKNTHGGVLILVKHTSPWIFFMLFKLYKLYQIAQRITYAWICLNLR